MYAHTHTHTHHSRVPHSLKKKKNKILSFAARWMHFEGINIVRRHKERQILCVVTEMWNLINEINEYRKINRLTDTENKWSQVEKGKRGGAI